MAYVTVELNEQGGEFAVGQSLGGRVEAKRNARQGRPETIMQISPQASTLLFAGRAGTSLTSEIGLMGATDQLAAMEMMAVDPVRRVCAPRFIGGFLSMP